MGDWLDDAHPFFWLVLGAMVPSTLAACLAGSRAPNYALHSSWVYRLEVGVAFFIGAYILGVVVWLAYQGRSVRGIQLPGGPAVELPDPNLRDAAEGFEEFRQKVDGALERHEESLEELDDRIAELQERRT